MISVRDAVFIFVFGLALGVLIRDTAQDWNDMEQTKLNDETGRAMGKAVALMDECIRRLP